MRASGSYFTISSANCSSQLYSSLCTGHNGHLLLAKKTTSCAWFCPTTCRNIGLQFLARKLFAHSRDISNGRAAFSSNRVTPRSNSKKSFRLFSEMLHPSMQQLEECRRNSSYFLCRGSSRYLQKLRFAGRDNDDSSLKIPMWSIRNGRPGWRMATPAVACRYSAERKKERAVKNKTS